MFNGTVTFRASINGNGLMTFPSVEFNPHEPGVDKVEIEAPNGDHIRSTVHVVGVPTHDDGKTLAWKVNTVALNRLSYLHDISIGDAQMTGHSFTPVNPPAGAVLVASTGYLSSTGSAMLSVGLGAANVKAELELPPLPGERNYGLFRSARQSASPVEEFTHLYNILLGFYNTQFNLDAFISTAEPRVPQTVSPYTGGPETVYTRLRNELAHPRAGVNLEHTKTEMANWVGGLRALTQRAILLHP